MENKKYLLLDFGKVLAYPVTGHWFVTPYMNKIADKINLDIDKLKTAMASYSPILSRKVCTLEEEEKMFFDYYKNACKESDQDISDDVLWDIAKDTTHNDEKYGFYDTVRDELEELSKKYKIIMVSDNWPCSFRIMKNADLEKYFDKMYISSVYGKTKKDKVLFDYPLNEFGINKGEAIFVDDNEELLDIASEKGLDVRLMNRDNESITSNYKIITNLSEI